MRKLIVILLALLVLSNNNLFSQNSSIHKLDSYFEKALLDWNVPGMAIGIIRNDTIILAKGYGLTNSDKNQEVNSKTIFPIASNSKAFTSAALASLVDKEIINWDDKVVDYIPYFKLYDPYVTQSMTIRDLLCHRSGLATFSGDLLWFNSTYSREEVIRRAQFLEPKFGFRTSFGYSNIMFITAGEVIPVLTTKSWDIYLMDSFFIPLGMNRTNTSISLLDNMENVASPHNDIDGKLIPIPYQNWDNIGGAGAINSCVDDMINWLNLQLHEGRLNDRQYFSSNSAWEMWSPHTVQKVSKYSSQRFPTMHFKSYGLGWGLFDYHGRKVISHSGGYDGMISYSCIVPEEQLGFVILTNSNSSLYYPLVYKILDEFLSDQDLDWSGDILKIINRNKEYSKKVADTESNKRIKATSLSLDLSGYTGTYTSKLYGKAEVVLKKNKLSIKLIPSPLFEGELDHWQYNTFSVKMINFPSLPSGKINFYIGMDGAVEEMKIDIPNPDFDFTELKFIKDK